MEWMCKVKEIEFLSQTLMFLSIYLHLIVGDLRYFKLGISLDQIMIVLNIKGWKDMAIVKS